jgi:hypothetical protein
MQDEVITEVMLKSSPGTEDEEPMLVTKATETRAEYAKYLQLFHGNSGYENAPRCYVTLHCLYCLFYTG